MTEHYRPRETNYRPHAVGMPAQSTRYARPMAVRVGAPLAGPSARRAWHAYEAPGLRAALWRTVLNVVHTMWAE